MDKFQIMRIVFFVFQCLFIVVSVILIFNDEIIAVYVGVLSTVFHLYLSVSNIRCFFKYNNMISELNG